MKRIIIYITLLLIGIVLFVVAIFCSNNLLLNILLSIGSGLMASSLTAGLIDFSTYIDFKKKRKYIRNIELHHLSLDILLLARQITGEYELKDIDLLKERLSTMEITEENETDIMSWLNSKRSDIELELNTVRENQNYFSLSGCFTEQEISFLCRSINYYDKDTSESNVKFVIANVASYLEMFRDTI